MTPRLLWSVVAGGLVSAACAASFTAAPDGQTTGDDGGADGNGLPTGPGDSSTSGSSGGHDTGAPVPPGPITVKPVASTLDVAQPGSPATVQFTASVNGTPIAPAWSVDDASFGAIDATGLFTASGDRGGVANVTASVGQRTGMTTLTIHLHLVDRDGTLTALDVQKLKNGGNDDPAWGWLSPGTDGGPNAVVHASAPPQLAFTSSYDEGYFHFTGTFVEYELFARKASFSISAARWAQIAKSADTGTAAATKLSFPGPGETQQTVSGPVSEAWAIVP